MQLTPPEQKLSLVTARQLFDYNPETGRILWRVRRGRFVRPGDEAGTVNKDGFLVIGVGKFKILGHYLAWLLCYGEWPKERIVPKGPTHPGYRSALDPDGNEIQVEDNRWKADLRIANIVPWRTFLDPSAAAEKARQIARAKYARRHAGARAPDGAAPRPAVPASAIPGVVWYATSRLWVAEETRIDPQTKRPCTVEFGRFVRQQEAEQTMLDLLRMRDFLAANPPRPTTEEDARNVITSGRHNSLDLATAVDFFAYNPLTGEIWRRDEYHAPARSDREHPDGYRFVHYGQGRYPAHCLAWWLMTGRYPDRKAVGHRDANRLNNVWLNLVDRSAEARLERRRERRRQKAETP